MNLEIKLYGIEYEHQGRTWTTAIEAQDKEHAQRIFTRDNPHVKCLTIFELEDNG